MTPRLAQRVAIVTGGASGFGRATALLFAEQGARVVLGDLDTEHGAQVVAEIVAAGGQAEFVHGDVSDAAVAERLVNTAVSRFGAVDVLVNNAGIAQDPREESWNAAEDMWDRIIRVNLRSVYVCTRAAVPTMQSAGRGAIVNIASIAATVSTGGSAYAASKGGMLSYSRHIAVELAPVVRVNCVSPGFMRTPMSTGERRGVPQDAQERRMADFATWNPMRRAGAAADIANAALYLASDESAFVTGQQIVVDGGHLVFSH